MSTRTLSAYFDDVRKGRKDVALIRQFLLETYDRDPVKRGHLLHWLDQAQYEHPIPVTEFLILRKEVESTLKRTSQRPAPDEATVIAAPTTPDAMTLVATAITTQATEATDVKEAATLIAQPVDATPLPERSDHAGQHHAATTINPAPISTQTLTALPTSPGRSFAVSRRFLLWSALVLVVVALLAVLLLRDWLGQQPAFEHDARPATAEVNHVLQEAPAGSIGSATNSAPVIAIEPAEIIAPATSPAVNLGTLTEPELQQEFQKRIEEGHLLPATAPDSAYTVLWALEQRFPDSTALLQDKITLKNAHLKRSDEARGKGDWALAQQHLDAAFDVLQQAAK